MFAIAEHTIALTYDSQLFCRIPYELAHFGLFVFNHFSLVPKNKENMVTAASLTFDPGR